MKTHASLLAAALAVALVLGVSGGTRPALSWPAMGAPQVAPACAVSLAPRPAVGMKADFGRVPLHFIANTGQFDGASRSDAGRPAGRGAAEIRRGRGRTHRPNARALGRQARFPGLEPRKPACRSG
jgi:hypothetical protein